MNLIGIDSLSGRNGVAVMIDGRIASCVESVRPGGGLFSRRKPELMPLVDAALRDAGIGCGDISACAITAGPGSYTGIRVGISTVQGLAFGSSIAIAAVDTLDALAAVGGEVRPASADRIVPVVQMRRGEWLVRLAGTVHKFGDTESSAIPASSLLVVIGDPPPDCTAEAIRPSASLASTVARIGFDLVARGRTTLLKDLAPLYMGDSYAT